MNRSRIRLLWLAAGVLACVVVAIGLVIWKIMPVAAIVDGWGTGVLFSVVWVGITQYYAVERPAERQLRNATVAVLVELSANYEALAFRNSVSVGGMVFDMFDQHGPTVMGALDVGAATALMGLYRGQRNLASFRIYRVSGWFLARQLDQARSQGAMEEMLRTFLRGVEKLNLSVEPAVDSVRSNFAKAYRVRRTQS